MPVDLTPTNLYNPNRPLDESHPDPYSTSTTTSTTNYGLPPHIDISSLPSGSPITSLTPAVRAARIGQQMAQLSQAVRRPLTESEETAIAYHSAKALATATWAPVISLAASAYRTYTTRAEYRWPLYGKIISEAPAEGEVQKGFWDGQKMRMGGREIFQGVSREVKAMGLHLSRGTAYYLFASVLVLPLVNVYAAVVSTAAELRDPRLQELNQGVREATQAESKKKRGMAGEIVKQTDARKEGRMPSFPADRDHMRGTRGGVAEVDDASPTGGAGMMMDMGMDEEQERSGGVGDMGGLLSDGQMRTAEAKARPQPGQSPTSNRTATFQMERVERQPKDFGSDFDDAGPTTDGSGANMDNGDGSGGSVWERIRQQSASDPSGSNTGRARGTRGSGVQQEQQEGSTTGDSFTFSRSDQERSYAKSEAQREFDERVEKERRGGDFSGEGRRRW